MQPTLWVYLWSCLLFSHEVVSDSLWPHGLQHAMFPCLSPSPGVCPNSCPLSQWYHSTILSYVVSFSRCLQSFPESGSFPVSQLFTSGGQSFGASTSPSVSPMNIQDWFSLGWTSLISLQSKGLSKVFSNTTVQKHQFFGTQSSVMVQLSHPYMTTVLSEIRPSQKGRYLWFCLYEVPRVVHFSQTE